jgi:hypothetical protein
MPRRRQAFNIVCLAAILALVFAIFVGLVPWRAELAETNYQANLIRLQTLLFEERPQAVLVGSSLTGRLLPSYFQGTALAPMANLGLDGSSPLLGLDLVLRRPPKLVIVEENMLLKPWDSNDESLAAATRQPSFELARRVPFLRACYRPSSVLYTWFKLRRNTGGTGSVPATTKAPTPTASPETAPSPTNGLAFAKETLRRQIQGLNAAGTKVVMMRLPAGSEGSAPESPAFALGEELAREFQLRQVDLVAECGHRGQPVTYTDGMHLTPASAQGVSRLLADLLRADPVTASTQPGPHGR